MIRCLLHVADTDEGYNADIKFDAIANLLIICVRGLAGGPEAPAVSDALRMGVCGRLLDAGGSVDGARGLCARDPRQWPS